MARKRSDSTMGPDGKQKILFVPEHIMSGIRDTMNTWRKLGNTSLDLAFSIIHEEVYLVPLIPERLGHISEFSGDEVFTELVELIDPDWKLWQGAEAYIRFDVTSGELKLDVMNSWTEVDGEHVDHFSDKERQFRLDVNGPGELMLVYEEGV